MVEMRDLARELTELGMQEAAREALEVIQIIETGNDRIQMRLSRLLPLQGALHSDDKAAVQLAGDEYMRAYRAAERHKKPAKKKPTEDEDE